jgi:hypothetical protein
MVKVKFGRDFAEVEDDLFGVVKEIMRIWPNLRVQYLDPDRALLSDAPYRIVEELKTGELKQVFSVWSLDSSVIDRLHAIDSHRGIDIEALVEAENAKVRKNQEAKAQEELAAGADIVASAVGHFRQGKLEFQYTNDHGDKRVIREDGARSKKVEVL